MADYIITKSWLPGQTLTGTARNTQGEVIFGPVEMNGDDDGNYMVLWSAYAGQQGYFSFSDGTFSETEAFGNPQRLTTDYDAAKTAAAAGDAMALTADYDAAKTAASEANATANKAEVMEAIDDLAGGELTAQAVRVEMDAHSTKLAAIKTRTDLISAYTVRVVAPLTPGGTLYLTIGDGYLASHGRAIQIAETDPPDYTGATVTLSVVRLSDNVEVLNIEATSTDNNTLVFEPPAADTATLTAVPCRWVVQAVWASDDPPEPNTRAAGDCVITPGVPVASPE